MEDYIMNKTYTAGLRNIHKITLSLLSFVFFMVLSVSHVFAADVSIDDSSFPDSSFRKYVASFDTDSDGRLSSDEIAAVSSIDVSSLGIKDLTGISVFTGVTYLDCSGNPLTKLDLRGLKSLTYIDCSGSAKAGGGLKSLNLSGLSNVLYLSASDGALTSVDTSSMTYLDYLDVSHNQFSSINLSKNPYLKGLDVSSNLLRSIDLSPLRNLEILYIEHNDLTSLNLSSQSKLGILFCGNNALTSLDLSGCPKLTQLDYSFSVLPSVDVSKLYYLDVHRNYCNITSAADTDAGIRLTWNRAPSYLRDEYGSSFRVDGYIILRKDSSGMFTEVGRVSGAATRTFTDTTAPVGKSTYTVRPYNSASAFDEYNRYGITGTHKGWRRDSRGYWYDNGDGTYPKNGWAQISGSWYYFDKYGYRMTGWLSIGTRWYYLGSDGAMVSPGWHCISSKWYFFDSNGVMLSNRWLGEYFLKYDGSMAESEWVLYNGSYYYVNAKGMAVYGWQKIGRFKYYFDRHGRMLSNCFVDGHYLRSDGSMAY